MNKALKKVIIIHVVVVTIVLAVFFVVGTKDFDSLKKSVTPTVSLYPEAKLVSSVLNFVDDNSKAVHLSELSADKWVLMYFGYASCPDVCPMDLVKISQTIQKMQEKDDLQVVFVSVDPQRDIGMLDAFVKSFNSDFIGLSAFAVDLLDISKTLGVYHQVIATKKRAESESHEEHANKKHKHYDMDHTTSYLLLNPDLDLTAVLPNPHYPDTMAVALDKIIITLR